MLVINVEWINLTKQITISNKELIKNINVMDSNDKMSILIGILEKLEDNPELLSGVFHLLNKVKKEDLTILQKGLLKKALKHYID